MNESSNIINTHESVSEISLIGLLQIVWSGKWLIAGIASLFAALAVTVVLLMPDIFRSEVLLAPNQEQEAGGLAGLASQYGGLASLAGINLSGKTTDKTVLGLEILKSRQFIADFVKNHDILVPLMAAKKWNRSNGELVIDQKMYDSSTNQWVRKASPPRTAVPSMQEAHEAFLSIISINRNQESGFVSISIEHVSPIVAKQWLDWLVEDLNQVVMTREVTEATSAIEYLEQQIAETSLAGLREVFYSLIEEQTKTVILANVSKEYLLRTIDPAVAPEEKSRPLRAIIVLLTVFIGGIFGVAAQLFRSGAFAENTE